MVGESLAWLDIPTVPPVSFLSSTLGMEKRGTEEDEEGKGVMEEVEVEAAEEVDETEAVDLLPILGDMSDFQLLSNELNFWNTVGLSLFFLEKSNVLNFLARLMAGDFCCC